MTWQNDLKLQVSCVQKFPKSYFWNGNHIGCEKPFFFKVEVNKNWLWNCWLGLCKVKKIVKGSLDLFSSPLPSLKIQIMDGKVCLMCEGKSLLAVVNKLLKLKRLLTIPGNVLPLHLSKLSLPLNFQ